MLFKERGNGGHVSIIASYVDDLSLAGNNMVPISWMKAELTKMFDMMDLGKTKHCLGLEISRVRPHRKLWLSQTKYASTVLNHFEIAESRPVPSAMEDSSVLE